MATKTKEQNIQIRAATKEEQSHIVQLVDDISAATLVTKAAADAEKELKDQLRSIAKEFWFTDNSGAGEPIHVYDAVGRNNVAQLNFVNKYKLGTGAMSKLKDLLGQSSAEKMLEESGEISINVTGLTMTDRAALLTAVSDTCHDLYQVDPGDVTLSGEIKVKKSFHNDRHADFNLTANELLDEILPVQVHITV